MLCKKIFPKPDIFPHFQNVVLFLLNARKTPTHVHSEESAVY